MAEAIQRQISILEAAQSALEQAVPLVVTPSRLQEGLHQVVKAAEQLEQSEWDSEFASLATAMKLLANGGSSITGTTTFQGFLVEVLESVTKLIDQARNSGVPSSTDAAKLAHVGQFIVKLSARITNRYKLNVNFEPEYEAKSLRAFMVVKELSSVVRFLNIAPDISENANANLDNGLEVDCLSQESPEELHRIAGSVLEVQSVQVFRETKALPVDMLDPPHNPSSFDAKIADFLNK